MTAPYRAYPLFRCRFICDTVHLAQTAWTHKFGYNRHSRGSTVFEILLKYVSATAEIGSVFDIKIHLDQIVKRGSDGRQCVCHAFQGRACLVDDIIYSLSAAVMGKKNIIAGDDTGGRRVVATMGRHFLNHGRVLLLSALWIFSAAFLLIICVVIAFRAFGIPNVLRNCHPGVLLSVLQKQSEQGKRGYRS